MSLTSYRAAPSRAKVVAVPLVCQVMSLTRRLCCSLSLGERVTHAGCAIPRQWCSVLILNVSSIFLCIEGDRLRDTLVLLIRFGSDLLSHALRRSTISAAALNGRVRDGIGCFARAMTTKSKK